MSRRFWLLLIVCFLAEQVGCKSSLSLGRGRSSARASSPSRGSSASRTYGGGMGSIAQNRNTGSGYGNGGYRGTNMATGGFNRNTGGGYNRNTGGGFASSGGFNRNSGWKNNKNYNRQSYPQTSRYTKGSGIGSALRSNTFKNMLVGAAAGYLTYQAGKFLIRNAMAPMMWNNRPYYWGQNYYQPRPNTQMCRMPLDPSDPQLGNVYFQDQSQRPREIVWGCGYNEHCCGYECCPGTMGMGGASMGGGGYPMNSMGGGIPAAGAGAIAGAGASESALSHGLSVRPAQSIGVRGQLRCNGMPAAGVLVKLYDHDTFTLDDKIASGRTDALGNFMLAGHEHEFTRVTPKLNIYHDCNDWLPCQRKISIYIPKEFVSQGEVAQRIYDAGTMELSGSFEGESRDCFH